MEWARKGFGALDFLPANYPALPGDGTEGRGSRRDIACGSGLVGTRVAPARSAHEERHPHVVPLSDLAIEFLKEAFHDAGRSAFAFPCGEGALSPIAVARTILRANDTSEERPLGRFGVAPWSAHDLRRTALTGMAQLGVAPIVLGHVANHRTTTRAGITLGVYNKYAYDKEKRAALNLWADRVRAIVEGNGTDVVPLLRGTAPS
jgi:integrase